MRIMNVCKKQTITGNDVNNGKKDLYVVKEVTGVSLTPGYEFT